MAETIKTKQNGKTRAQLILILMQAYGRPITASDDPVAAYNRCVREFVGE